MKRLTLLVITLVFSATACLLSSCFPTTVSTYIPMKSNLNDFVTLSIKADNKLPTSYQYHSMVRDGETVARDPDFGNVIMIHSESNSFKKMLDDYMGNKFLKIHQAAETKIIITLQDFYMDRKMLETKSSVMLKALGGGEFKQLLSVYVQVLVQVIYNGREYVKKIGVSQDDSYAASIAVSGKDSFEYVYGELINKANNKALMMLNRFLEGIGI